MIRRITWWVLVFFLWISTDKICVTRCVNQQQRTRVFVYSSMPSLVLNEATLFYLNLSTTATTTSSSFNKVKSWTSRVAKANHIAKPTGNSAYASSSKSSIPSKRTTSSSSAVVRNTEPIKPKPNTHPQPERKKHKSDHLTTSEFLEDEDETVERQAAILSPVKGNQRLNSKVRFFFISHCDIVLT